MKIRIRLRVKARGVVSRTAAFFRKVRWHWRDLVDEMHRESKPSSHYEDHPYD